MFLVVMPVLIPLYQSYGLSMQEVFELQALFGITVVISEIPTGYLGDLFGRKKSLLMGSFISALGFSLLVFAKSYNWLAVFQVIIGIGSSFVSGSDISLLYDSVEGDRASTSRAVANFQLGMMVGESSASLLGGFLATYSFAYVLWVNALSAWGPFFIALTLKESHRPQMKHESHLKNLKEAFLEVFCSSDRILRLVSLNLLVWGSSTFFAVWIHQRYWQDNQIPLAWFGVLWAVFNISVGLVGKQVHRIEKHFGPIPLMWVLAVAPIAAYILMTVVGGPWAGAVGLLFSVSRGINGVLLRDALNWRISSTLRATANSLQSFAFRLVFAVFGPAVGFLIDHHGMKTALLVLAAVFSLAVFAVLMPLIRRVKEMGIEYIPDRA